MLSEEQVKARASGLGGTDVVAILGESNYRSAIDVYLEKRHALGLPIGMAPPRPFEGNERTEWGHILEPIVADRYAADTGLVLVEPSCTYRHPDRPWQVGTPDRLCYSASAPDGGTSLRVLDSSDDKVIWLGDPVKLWEGKTHGMMAAKGKYDLDAMTVPDDKRIQVAWYMSLTGCRDADLSALVDTHIYRVFRIPHDQQVEDYLLEEAELFWRKVVNGVEPLPDGTDGFTEYLKGRFQQHAADMIEMPAEVASHIATYKACRADAKVAEGKMQLAAQEIQLAIGHHEGLLAGGKPVVTWKRKSVGATSYAKLVDHLRDELKLPDKRFDELKDKFTGEPGRNFLVK